MNAWFIVLGALGVIAGLALLVPAIRHHREQSPKHVAMLIGGMMLTAFGLFLTGFAIAFNSMEPAR